MKYIHHDEHGGLSLREQAPPVVNSDEVLIDVKAFGINRADLLQKQGKYPPPKGASPILGLEVSGVIKQRGDNVSQWRVGDRVCAMLSGGGYANEAVIKANQVMALPDALSFEQGAAFPEVYLTAFQVLDWIADVQSQQNVLIHAGASGVGLAAIQLAKKKGANVAVTVSSPEKAQSCLAKGADVAIAYQEQDFYDVLKEQWGGVDVVVDMVSAHYTNKNLKLLNLDGKIVDLAILGGRFVEQFDTALLLGKRASLIGTTLRNRSDKYKAKLVADFTAQHLTQIAQGELELSIDTVFPAEQIEMAHQRLQQNNSIGKFVVTW